MLKVSPFFAHLYDLYLEQVQHLSRDGQGQESDSIRQQSLIEHRKKASDYFVLINTDPEFAAPVFYDLFDFRNGTANDYIAEMVGLNKSNLPRSKQVMRRVILKTDADCNLFNTVLGIDGGYIFLLTVIGLEYLRFVDWVPESMAVPILEPDDPDDDEEGWLRNEAPEILGLDALVTNNE